MSRRSLIDGLGDVELELIFGKVDFAERCTPALPDDPHQLPSASS